MAPQVIRKLRWNLSLYKEGGDFVIDTTLQRHKSESHHSAQSRLQSADTPLRVLAASKFYGPTKTTVSKLVAPWLQLYVDQLQFEYHPKEQPYLWGVGGDYTRCQESSQWCATVKQAFQRWSPGNKAPPPKVRQASLASLLPPSHHSALLPRSCFARASSATCVDRRRHPRCSSRRRPR